MCLLLLFCKEALQAATDVTKKTHLRRTLAHPDCLRQGIPKAKAVQIDNAGPEIMINFIGKRIFLGLCSEYSCFNEYNLLTFLSLII